jgi:nitrogen fixation/metabolism regulation signal transduction histidine kinase
MSDLKTLQTENRELKRRFEQLTAELKNTRRQIQSNMAVKLRLDTQITGVLGHLGCGAISINLSGELMQVNRAAADMLACNPDDLIGSPCQNAIYCKLQFISYLPKKTVH